MKSSVFAKANSFFWCPFETGPQRFPCFLQVTVGTRLFKENRWSDSLQSFNIEGLQRQIFLRLLIRASTKKAEILKLICISLQSISCFAGVDMHRLNCKFIEKKRSHQIKSSGDSYSSCSSNFLSAATLMLESLVTFFSVVVCMFVWNGMVQNVNIVLPDSVLHRYVW